MKKFTKVVEAYEMEMENYEDFATEHAKVVIAKFIDGELDGASMQSAFAEMVKDNGLEGEDGEGPQEMTIDALTNFVQDMLDQIKSLELVNVLDEDSMTKQAELDAAKKPIGDNPGVM
jgi:hypothetical protein